MGLNEGPKPKDKKLASDEILASGYGLIAGIISKVLPETVNPISTFLNLNRPTQQEALEALKELHEISMKLP